MLNRLKQQIRIIESILTEGDHWPEDYRRKAINRIKLATGEKTPKYVMSDIEGDVDKMMAKFKPLLHKNSNVGYFLPVIRMFIDYAGNDKNKQTEFIDKKIANIVTTLNLISNDPSLESKFKDDIKQKWSLEDFEKHAAEIQAEIAKNDANSLASVGNSHPSDYGIIKINSYEELYKKFGGDKTGYKGQSEWCHTNGESTYDSWTKHGTYQFFILAKKGWENIQPPDPETTNAYDEYGTSLIAILVSIKDGELLNATLRWNHVIEPGKTVPKTSVDKAFLGWGDLSKAVGFNVKTIVDKEIKEQRDELKNKIEKANKEMYDKLKTVTEINENTIPQKYRQILTHVEIPDNVTSIGYGAFDGCHSLASVTIPNTVTSIGERAFASCTDLTSITIPNSVTRIGNYAFNNCSSLTSVTIPDSITSIGWGTFYVCKGLTSVTIPNSVTRIADWAFCGCEALTQLTIPDSVTSIGNSAFTACYSLTNITIPEGVTSIGNNAFHNCSDLTSITIPSSVTSIGKYAFVICDSLSSAIFTGKTLDEVRSMKDYPWGIKNSEEVITVEAGND